MPSKKEPYDPDRLEPKDVEAGWAALATLERLRDQKSPLDDEDWLAARLAANCLTSGCLKDALTSWRHGDAERARRLMVRYSLLCELKSRLDQDSRVLFHDPYQSAPRLALLLLALRQPERARRLIEPLLARGGLLGWFDEGDGKERSGPLPFAWAVLTGWLGGDPAPIEGRITPEPYRRLARLWQSASVAELRAALTAILPIRRAANARDELFPHGEPSLLTDILGVIQLRGLHAERWEPPIGEIVELVGGLEPDRPCEREQRAAAVLQALVDRSAVERAQGTGGADDDDDEKEVGETPPDPPAAKARAALEALGARAGKRGFLPGLLHGPATVHTDWRFDPLELVQELAKAIAAAPDLRALVAVKVSRAGGDDDDDEAPLVVRVEPARGKARKLVWEGPDDDADAIAFGLAKQLPEGVVLAGVRALWGDDATAHVVASAERWDAARAALGDAFDAWFSTRPPRGTPEGEFVAE